MFSWRRCRAALGSLSSSSWHAWLGPWLVAALATSCSGSANDGPTPEGGGLGAQMENAGLDPDDPAGASGEPATMTGNEPAGSGEGTPTNVMNGTDSMDPMTGPGANGSGVAVGGTCFALCADGSTDPDAMGVSDGYGFELGVSCIVPGSPPALMGTACEPMSPMTELPPGLIPGPGFFVGGTCFPPCASAATDANEAGVTDGFGFEQGLSCVVPGSAPSEQGLPCDPGTSPADGDGYLVGELCVPACVVERLADAQGYGYEARQTCVVENSPAAIQAARCTILPREGLPTPGDGFELGEGCFPPCVNAAGTDAAGFGFEQNRACVLPGSDASIQGVPCIPAPPDVIGFCPPSPIACPVANGVVLTCGCGFRDGYAERKQVILNTPGASRYFLASAMMETDTLTANYPLGDVFPGGALKTGDAFNGGIAKQNWGMMRRCHPVWTGLGGGDYLTGAELNTNLALDIQVYNECRQMFGNSWWSGHRLGFNRLGDNGPDVQRFRAAMDWTDEMLEGHLDDDVFFYVVVPAI